MKLLPYVLLLLLVGAAWYGVSHRRAEVSARTPTTVKEFKQLPAGKMTAEAGEYLLGLAKAGQLPGFSKGEHGAMQAGTPDARENTPSEPEPFPVSRVIHFSKTGDDSDYFYAVLLQSNGGSWKLQRAWRADPQGRVRQNYPIP